MKKTLSAFWKDESGATAVEYGLIAALIGVAIVGGATAVGTGLDATFGDVSAQLGTPAAAPPAGGGGGGGGGT